MDKLAPRNQRLDQKVVELQPSISRAFAEKLVESGKVKLNKTVFLKTGYKLRPDDIVEVDYDAEQQTALPSVKIPILYQDDDCLVINKPDGLLSHSKGAFNPEPTIASWLSQHLSGLSGDRAGIVHRLDRATSGVMICAKTAQASLWLQKQFARRQVKKVYMAIIEGQLKNQQALIDMPLERNPKKPHSFRVGINGKSALTDYQVLETTPKLSLVELIPQTGRTHQLRVHMHQLGHPILGDQLYGGKPASRLFLHALSLEICLPSGKRQLFTAPLPSSFKKALRQE
ncbi:MAG TPA: RluA family pseudouridine synthase [Candidatus Dormibacteraeota bacterium]|nr:RluA family pseudouridine synthase [Candidatus Dormibacteraeota bacterium]